MTNRTGSLERAVIRSSVMPSLKYSCSRSPLMLVNGSTAIEGLSGNDRAGDWVVGIDAVVVGGRSETCWISTITATTSAIPPIDHRIPLRRSFRRGAFVVAMGLVSAASADGLASATAETELASGTGEVWPTSRIGAAKR